jgi:hypothetical protein
MNPIAPPRPKLLIAPAFLLLLSGLACEDDPSPGSVSLAYDFAQGAQGWVAGFVDYPVSGGAEYELDSGYRTMPAPFDTSEALYISGHNRSDDLFMYYRVQANGLRPDTEYRITFSVEILTNAPMNCPGVGGAPGESVYLKAGASTAEPKPIDMKGTYRLSVDKGNQAAGGENALVLGNVANSYPCDLSVPWDPKSLALETPLRVRTDAAGSLWLFMGSDSGYEGLTSLYYTRFTATLHPE